MVLLFPERLLDRMLVHTVAFAQLLHTDRIISRRIKIDVMLGREVLGSFWLGDGCFVVGHNCQHFYVKQCSSKPVLRPYERKEKCCELIDE